MILKNINLFNLTIHFLKGKVWFKIILVYCKFDFKQWVNSPLENYL